MAKVSTEWEANKVWKADRESVQNTCWVENRSESLYGTHAGYLSHIPTFTHLVLNYTNENLIYSTIFCGCTTDRIKERKVEKYLIFIALKERPRNQALGLPFFCVVCEVGFPPPPPFGIFLCFEKWGTVALKDVACAIVMWTPLQVSREHLCGRGLAVPECPGHSIHIWGENNHCLFSFWSVAQIIIELLDFLCKVCK